MKRHCADHRNQCCSFSSLPSLFQLSFSQCEPSFALPSSCKAVTGDREHIEVELQHNCTDSAAMQKDLWLC